MVVERDRLKKAHREDLAVERGKGKIKKAHGDDFPLIFEGDFSLRYTFLTQQFYDDHAECREIEAKVNRPYVKVLVEIEGHTFAVPLRSHIAHPHVLWTDRERRCGLDFSKAVVVDRPEYIDTSRVPHIRQNEFDALRGKEYIVETRMRKYIADYKKARARLDIPRNRVLCRYSTLQYFEDCIYEPVGSASE